MLPARSPHALLSRVCPGLLLLFVSMGVRAQSLPPNFSDALVMGGWNAPVGATFDANGRLYVWEKAGRVWIVQNGVRLPQPLIDISQEVGDWRDHGCLGFALDPNFLSNGRIYLMYLVDRHHLMHYGTPNYNPAANEYYAATIMRITRYTAIGPNFNTVDHNSRHVLVGETKETGIPLLFESHSTGSLVFGTDGTLLASTGDGASYNNVDVGSDGATYYQQALADGILRPAENVGALRSQMVTSLCGKVLRLDPETGNGVPSNPWYDPANPRSAKSRVWALGLRNPYRMTLKPNSGSTNPADGRPGTLYIGDVGWYLWEDLNVCYEGGMNFGWPLFEGHEPTVEYSTMAPVMNLDAPNPLYDGVNCTQPYFTFQDLLKQAAPVHTGLHPNPCNPGVQVPATAPRHFHSRPAIDWLHGNRSRSSGFAGSTPVTYDLDAPGAPVPGPRFGGNAALAGPWISGENMPLGYQNSTFHGDFAAGWIRRFMFDENDAPVSVHDFASGLGAITWIGTSPNDGCVWYIRYDANQLRRICYTLAVNLPPVAVAEQDVQYGPGPLTVQFTGSNSSDPENGQLTYLWDFGDGHTSTDPDPQHSFTAAPGVVTTYNVTLTVTDDQGQSASAELIVSLNNTPPQVQIISFNDGDFYPLGVDTTYTLEAEVTDLEHGPGQLTYAWRTTLYHNTHNHPEPIDPAVITTTSISGVGCGHAETYHYKVSLTVTDAGGLSTTQVHSLWPRCHAIAPTAVIHADQSFGAGPFSVSFDGTSSYDPGTIVSYHWDFGDGTTATGPTPSKTFTEIGDYQVMLTVTDDDGLVGQALKVITVLDTAPPVCVGATGSIRREYWGGITGANVSDLINSPNFPDNPTMVTFPTSFQVPPSANNNFGTRMRGYIIAPTTGNYVFTATSDDASAVYLSPNADPQYKQLICSVPEWTEENEFNKYPSQVSAPIHLVAGRYYYVEMLQKEGSGGDHLALRWQTPTNSNRVVIPGSALARWEDCGPSVRVRVNLSGAWDVQANQMRDALRAAGALPLHEPYTALGYVHAGGGGGETMAASMLSTTGKNAIVDWVVVELRNAANPAQVVATKSALLQRDGDVVDVLGRTRLLFNVAPGAYKVAVRHRNHLGAMGLNTLTLGANEVGLDLTLPGTATYGTNAQTTLPNGRRALWCGEVHRDGLVKYTGGNNDRDAILTRIGGTVPTAILAGYHPEDVNLDGQVKYAGENNDRDAILITIGGVAPTNTRQQQLP
jgi:PKD repeat protein/glucose/arabinose dehydrogenase